MVVDDEAGHRLAMMCAPDLQLSVEMEPIALVAHDSLGTSDEIGNRAGSNLRE